MEFIIAFFGILTGAAITWWAAKHYYVKASQDLAAEAKELKRLSILMIRGLEEAGLVEIDRDDNGDIRGMKINRTATLKTDHTINASATVTRKQKT